MSPVRVRYKYLPGIVSSHQLTICLTREASNLSKISSNNNKGNSPVLVRFKKSNCASFLSFNATRSRFVLVPG